MPYYVHDLGLNLFDCLLQALNACAPTCQDPTHYCDYPSHCSPPSGWKCRPTIICGANSVWECSPTPVCVPPSGRVDERCVDHTKYCVPPSGQVALACGHTKVCVPPSGRVVLACDDQTMCAAPTAVGEAAGACGGDSCLSASRVVIQLQTVGSLDQLQDELRTAMDQVKEHQQRIEESMTDEDLETLRNRLDEKLRRVDTELKKRNR